MQHIVERIELAPPAPGCCCPKYAKVTFCCGAEVTYTADGAALLRVGDSAYGPPGDDEPCRRCLFLSGDLAGE
jgi:hypothetical protein